MSKLLILFVSLLTWSTTAGAQSIRGLPVLPTSGLGLQGTVGVGFADFKVISPVEDYRLERGTYYSSSLEKGFNVLHLYLTFGLSYMTATGVANYEYTNLSSSAHYQKSDVDFTSAVLEGYLGVKCKLIEDYWFRPYIEGGGIGNYNTITYASSLSSLTSVGNDFKRKDTAMGAGYYGEAGVEIQFAERFGIRLAARQSMNQSKKLETMNNRGVLVQNEIYYLSALFGM